MKKFILLIIGMLLTLGVNAQVGTYKFTDVDGVSCILTMKSDGKATLKTSNSPNVFYATWEKRTLVDGVVIYSISLASSSRCYLRFDKNGYTHQLRMSFKIDKNFSWIYFDVDDLKGEFPNTRARLTKASK